MIKLPKLTHDQRAAITQLILGAPLGAILPQTITSLYKKTYAIVENDGTRREKTILHEGRVAPEVRDHWVRKYDIDITKRLNPGVALLNSLTQPQRRCFHERYLRATVLNHRKKVQAGAVLDQLCKKGLLEKLRYGEYRIAPEVMQVYPGWLKNNQDKMNSLVVLSPTRPKKQAFGLEHLSPRNQMFLQYLNPGEMQMLESYGKSAPTQKAYNEQADRYFQMIFPHEEKAA